ncbi:MAG: sugar ABC transporter permease, partial [bacterium]|nr:sugar ABC transporter permease [bacterium]
MFKKKNVNELKHVETFSHHFKKYWQYYLLMLIPIIYYIVFRYIPMAGNIIAFRRYRAGHS